MNGKYAALLLAEQAKRKSLTPAQKRREFLRQQYIAKRVASTSLFVSVFGLSEHVYPYSVTGHRKAVTGYDALAIEATPLPWVICCYALCKDNNGNPYIKGMELHLSEPVKQSAINRALSHKHFEWMKAEVNQAHLLTLAWIATTSKAPTEKLAMQLFLELGAFEAFDLVTPTEDGGIQINLKNID